MSIRGIDSDPTDRAIVKSINEIGHQTGKYTIAEFVETRHIARILQEIGIDYIQGYWVGRPMPLAKILGSSRRTRQAEPG